MLGNNIESTRKILSGLQTAKWMTTGYDVTPLYTKYHCRIKLIVLYMSRLVLSAHILQAWKLLVTEILINSVILMISVTGHRQY